MSDSVRAVSTGPVPGTIVRRHDRFGSGGPALEDIRRAGRDNAVLLFATLLFFLMTGGVLAFVPRSAAVSGSRKVRPLLVHVIAGHNGVSSISSKAGRGPATPAGPPVLTPALQRVATETGAHVRALGPDSPRDWQVWEFPSNAAAERAYRHLAHSPNVRSVERAGLRHLCATVPNDTYFASSQWSLRNSGQIVGGFAGIPGVDIGATQYWDTTQGSNSIIVAVIDTGIDATHPDLAAHLWTNPGEIPGNGIDDDHNGFIDDIHGWGTYNNTPDISDTFDHGTRVAGIIGAVTNNGSGMAGVAWNVRIMVLNAFGPNGEAMDDQLIPAIDYAIANGASIINASWGGPDYTVGLRAAVERASQAGVLFCAAAGNEHKRMDLHPFYPASFGAATLLSVGATNNRDGLPSFTNRGGSGIDLFAPGVGILSTATGHTYGVGNGTSFSAPHVSGAAALLLSQSPGIDPLLAARKLRGAVEPAVSVTEQCRSGGRLYLPALLNGDSVAPGAVGDLRVVDTASNGVAVQWTAPGNDGSLGTAFLYDIRWSTTTLTASTFASGRLPAWIPDPSPAGETQTFNLAGLEPSTWYSLALKAADQAGNLSPMSNVVTFRTDGILREALSAGFENGAPGWQGDPPWHLTTDTLVTSAFSWSTDSTSAAPVGTYTLDSPSFSLAGFVDPKLTFQAWREFDEDYVVYPSVLPVAGAVEASTDGGATWVRVALDHSSHEPSYRETIDLAPFAGQASVRLRWELEVNLSTAEYTNWLINDVRVYDPARWMPEPVTFLDEPVGEQRQFPNDAEAYSDSATGGGWTTAINSRPQIGYVTAYSDRQLSLADHGGASATYTPRFQADGIYRISVSWPDTANAAGVVYRVRNASGETDVTMDQNGPVNGGRWLSLGEFQFRRGRSASEGAVILNADPVTGPATESLPGRIDADSIRFDFLSFTPALAAHSAWPLY